MKIIIIDDEVMERELLRVICHDIAPSIQVVADYADGRQGIQAVALHQPDVVFLDVQMPIMDGIQTARVLRENWPNLPLVIVSAHDRFDYARDAIEIGVLAYLLKPVSPEDLLGVFQKLARLMSSEPGTQAAKGKHEKSSKDKAFLHPIARVLHYIDNQLENELSLNTLAAIAGFHPVHLSRMFKKEFGIGISDYITKVRLQRAQALLLESPGLSIQDVAAAVGFNSAHYFSSVFRQNLKCSPSDFRAHQCNRLKNLNNALTNQTIPER